MIVQCGFVFEGVKYCFVIIGLYCIFGSVGDGVGQYFFGFQIFEVEGVNLVVQGVFFVGQQVVVGVDFLIVNIEVIKIFCQFIDVEYNFFWGIKVVFFVVVNWVFFFFF